MIVLSESGRHFSTSWLWCVILVSENTNCGVWLAISAAVDRFSTHVSPVEMSSDGGGGAESERAVERRHRGAGEADAPTEPPQVHLHHQKMKNTFCFHFAVHSSGGWSRHSAIIFFQNERLEGRGEARRVQGDSDSVQPEVLPRDAAQRSRGENVAHV